MEEFVSSHGHEIIVVPGNQIWIDGILLIKNDVDTIISSKNKNISFKAHFGYNVSINHEELRISNKTVTEKDLTMIINAYNDDRVT